MWEVFEDESQPETCRRCGERQFIRTDGLAPGWFWPVTILQMYIPGLTALSLGINYGGIGWLVGGIGAYLLYKIGIVISDNIRPD